MIIPAMARIRSTEEDMATLVATMDSFAPFIVCYQINQQASNFSAINFVGA